MFVDVNIQKVGYDFENDIKNLKFDLDYIKINNLVDLSDL